MNMQKIFAILFGLSIALSPLTAEAMNAGKNDNVEKKETKKEEPKKQKISRIKSFFKSSLDKTQKKLTSAWNWTSDLASDAWTNGGVAGKTFVLGVPTLVAGALYSISPTVTTWGVYGFKSIVAYLAAKSLLFPKSEKTWTKEIKKDTSSAWNWVKGIFISDKKLKMKNSEKTEIELKEIK